MSPRQTLDGGSGTNGRLGFGPPALTVAALLLWTALPLRMTAAQDSAGTSAIAAGVQGRVIGFTESGKLIGPITGASIELKDQTGNVVARTTSGKAGYYKISLSPGTYYYTVKATGYKDEDYGRGFILQNTVGYAVRTFSLTKGKNDPNHKPAPILPLKVGKITGRVLEKTADGILVGIPGARIALRKSPRRSLASIVAAVRKTKSHVVGHYEGTLAVGQWRASVLADGFKTLVDPKPIAIASGKTISRDFVLSRRVTPIPKTQGIRGSVAVRVRSDQAGTPLDVTLRIIPHQGGKEATLSLKPSERFSRNVPAGIYRVEARAKGYHHAWMNRVVVLAGRFSHVRLMLRPATSTPPVELPKPKGIALTVKILEQGPDKSHPVADVDLLIRRNGQSISEAARSTTDAKGLAQLIVDSPGTYGVLARKDGYEPAGIRTEIRKSKEVVELYLKRHAPTPKGPPPVVRPKPQEPPVTPAADVAVSGYVVYKDASSSTGYFGVNGTKIRWLGKRPVLRETVAKSNGRFDIKLPAGRYRVEVSPPAGYTSLTEDVVVRQGMKRQYFILKKIVRRPPTPQVVTVQGYVVVRSARVRGGYASVRGAKVDWMPRSGNGPSKSDTSDSGGRFTVKLPPGTYRVVIEPPTGYRAARRDVTVRSGMGKPFLEVARIEPSTPPVAPPVTPNRPPPTRPPGPTPSGVATVTVKVYRVAGLYRYAPVPGARIFVYRNRKPYSSPATAGRDGTASLRLPPGNYQIVVTMKGFQNVTKAFTLGGRSVTQNVYLEAARRPKPGPGTKPKPGPPPGGTVIPPKPLPVSYTLTLQITDKLTRRPLPGRLRIRLNGTKTIVDTNANARGSYSINLKPGRYYVQVGYASRNRKYKFYGSWVTISNRNVTLSVPLQPNIVIK